MTRIQLLMAAKLLEIAADEFANHGCNDVEESMFDGMTLADRFDLEVEWNMWNSGDVPGSDDFVILLRIGDSSLMHFLSHKIKELAEKTA